ncbi:MAG: winged helix-turn-helix domain-containing protein [Ardenticatenales bacterium]|nr:winged helix-turn-helix domain-containing protein [Ardenticatenales bacterium]
MTALQIQLLGGFAVTAAGAHVRPFPTRKTRALLVYLALQPGQNHSRASLAALLWPEADSQRAAHNLRQALASLRKGLDRYQAAAALTIDRYHVRFNPTANCQVDVLLLTAELAQGTIPALNTQPSRISRPLTGCLRVPDAPGLRPGWRGNGSTGEQLFWAPWLSWPPITRPRALAAAAGPPGGGRSRFDPLARRSHRELMRLLALAGDKASALAAPCPLPRGVASGVGC